MIAHTGPIPGDLARVLMVAEAEQILREEENKHD